MEHPSVAWLAFFCQVFANMLSQTRMQILICNCFSIIGITRLEYDILYAALSAPLLYSC
jgi:hypothetical protein